MCPQPGIEFPRADHVAGRQDDVPRIGKQWHALPLPWRNAEVLQDVLERVRMRAPGKRDPLAAPACVDAEIATESRVRMLCSDGSSRVPFGCKAVG